MSKKHDPYLAVLLPEPKPLPSLIEIRCYKRPYLSKRRAAVVAKRQGMRAYPCPFCNYFHLTSKT